MEIIIALVVGVGVVIFGSEYDTARKEELLRETPFRSPAAGYPVECQPYIGDIKIKSGTDSDARWH